MYVNRTALSHARLWFKLKSLPPFKCTLERQRSQYKICFGFLGVCVCVCCYFMVSEAVPFLRAMGGAGGVNAGVCIIFTKLRRWLVVEGENARKKGEAIQQVSAQMLMWSRSRRTLQPQRLRNGRTRLEGFKKQPKHMFNVIPQLKITDSHLQNMHLKGLHHPLFGNREAANILDNNEMLSRHPEMKIQIWAVRLSPKTRLT